MRSTLVRLRSSQSVVLGIICIGVFSTALDQTVVVAALPLVMVDLEIPLTDLDKASWIITGYLVSYTVAMPLVGRLSDVYGRVKMFQAALVIFAIGSALVALAPNFTWIIPARVIQAVGGGATVPIGLAMAVAAVSAEKRGIAIGLVAASAEAGSVVGPLYGGAIIEWIGWRWIFWFDVPQSLMLIALMAVLPNRPNPEARMDYLGALALGAALTVLTVALAQRSIFTVESVYPFVALAAGVTLVGILIVVERRAVQPLLASFLYTSKAFVSSNIAQFLVGIALIMALVCVPLMASTVMERGPLESALSLVRLTAAIPVGALVGGYILRWAGVREVCIVGLALMGTGLLFMSGWEADVGEVRLTLPLVTAGLGFGLVIPPDRRKRAQRSAQRLLGSDGLACHRISHGGDGPGTGRAVGLGHRALLQPDGGREHWVQLRGDGGHPDRSGRHRVPEPVYDIRFPVPDRHSAGAPDEGGRWRAVGGRGLKARRPVRGCSRWRGEAQCFDESQ